VSTRHRRFVRVATVFGLSAVAAIAGACGRGGQATTPSPRSTATPAVAPSPPPWPYATATWRLFRTTSGALHPDARGMTRGRPFHLPYGLVRFRVRLDRETGGGLALVPLAPSAARAQGFGFQGRGRQAGDGKGWVDEYVITEPVVAGTYRVDLAGKGRYTLRVYVAKP